MLLQEKNAHERDSHIVFEEKDHKYFVDGDSNYISVTTVIKEFFPKFDSDAIIQKMQKSDRWPQSPYYGMTADEIKKQWRDKANLAAELGTLLHASIENFYNGIEQTIDPLIDKEYHQFLRFKDYLQRERPTLEPYRTEWCVFHEEYRVSGSIDMIFIDRETGELHIYDWKRTPDMKKENRWQRGFAPLCHLDDCKYNHYSIQLNIYKFILETKYDKKVSSLHLVCFHPTKDEYQLEKVHDLQKEVSHLLEVAYNQKLYCRERIPL